MTYLNKYTSTGHAPVLAESNRDAAELIALRKARREFGKGGRVGALQWVGMAPNASWHEYSAFIGRRTGQRETTGHNVRFVLHVEEVLS